MNEQRLRTSLILIVDDDRTMRSLLNLAMQEEGYEVAEAENGEQCLSEYTHFQPDLILLDAVMPDINGFTCCQKIRSLPGGDRIPILIITVLDDPESVEQAFNAGATDYITKPIHWSVLSERVRRLLEGNRASTKLIAIEKQLRQQQAWIKLTSNIAEQLVSGGCSRDSICAVLSSIRECLQASKIALYQLDLQTYLESVPTEDRSRKDRNFSLTDLNLIAEYGELYQQGKPIVIEDVSQSDLPSAVVQQLKQLSAQVCLVPIKQNERLLGLLAIHFCSTFSQDKLSPNRLLDLANLLTITLTSN